MRLLCTVFSIFPEWPAAQAAGVKPRPHPHVPFQPVLRGRLGDVPQSWGQDAGPMDRDSLRRMEVEMGPAMLVAGAAQAEGGPQSGCRCTGNVAGRRSNPMRRF